MARYLFNLPDVQPSQKVRVDTASGSDSPATGLTTVAGDAISSTLTGNHGGELPEIFGPDGVTTLYLKTLTYSGAVTGSPVTVPGYNETPVLPGSAAYVSFGGPFPQRARDFPGAAGLPTVDTTVATATLGVKNAASGISSGTTHPADREYMRPFGVEPNIGASFPDNQGWLASTVYVKTSTPPWGIEFDVDTPDGVIEFPTKGSGTGGQMRFLVNDKLISYLTFSVAPTGTVTGGTFTLTYGGQTTGAIAWNADAPTVKTAIEALSTVGAGNTAVRGVAGGPWTIDMGASVANLAMSGTSSLTGTSPGLSVLAGVTAPGDGNGYRVTLTMTAGAGQYRVRVELGGNARIWGVTTATAGTITASPRRKPIYAALGDSFIEPTISDSTRSALSNDGLPCRIAYLAGIDLRPVGLGSTGLVNPSTGGKVKYADRIPEILAANPNLDGVVIFMSQNDASFPTAQVLTEAQNCITQFQAAGLTRYGQITFVSPWTNVGGASVPSSTIDQADAVRALCASLNIPYVDVLTPPVTGAISTALASSASAAATSVSCPVSIPVGSWIKIGQSGNQELRKVTGFTGSGPYSIQFTGQALANAHASGEPVLQVDSAEITTANAARYTGPDNTHPTILGALWRAKRIVARWISSIQT